MAGVLAKYLAINFATVSFTLAASPQIEKPFCHIKFSCILDSLLLRSALIGIKYTVFWGELCLNGFICFGEPL